MKIEIPWGDSHFVAVSELPATQKYVIERFTLCSQEDLFHHLHGFRKWVWEKGDVFCWSSVFNRFDALLEAYIQCNRKLLGMENTDPIQPSAVSTPSDSLILELLRVSTLILRNCGSKSLYNSIEHLITLLNSFNEDLLLASLRTLISWYTVSLRLRKAPPATISPGLIARLRAFCDFPVHSSNSWRIAEASNPLDSMNSLTTERDLEASPDTSVPPEFWSSLSSSVASSSNQENVTEPLRLPDTLIYYLSSLWQIGQIDPLVLEYVSSSSPLPASTPSPAEEGVSSTPHSISSSLSPCALPVSQSDTTPSAIYSEKKDPSTPIGNTLVVITLPNEELTLHDTSILFSFEYPTSWTGDSNNLSAESARAVFEKVVAKYSLPEKCFPLVHQRIRILRGLYCSKLRKKLIDVRFSAMTLLTFMNEGHALSLNASLINDVAAFIKVCDKLEPSTMGIVVELLSFLLQERSPLRAITQLFGLNSPHGLFVSILRKYLSISTACDKPLPVLMIQGGKKNSLDSNPNKDILMDSSNTTEEEGLGEIIIADSTDEECIESWTEKLSTPSGITAIDDIEQHVLIINQLLSCYIHVLAHSMHPGVLSQTGVIQSLVDLLRLRDPLFLPVIKYVARGLDSILDTNRMTLQLLWRDLSIWPCCAERLQYDVSLLLQSPWEIPAAFSKTWPEGLLYPEFFKDSLDQRVYWLTLGETLSRRTASRALFNHLSVIVRPSAIFGTPSLAELLMPSSILTSVVRCIFKNTLRVGPELYSACLSFTFHFLEKVGGSYQLLQRQETYQAMLDSITADVLTSESVVNAVGLTLCNEISHPLGEPKLAAMSYAPVRYLIHTIFSPEFVLYDRSGSIASQIGLKLGSAGGGNQSILREIIFILHAELSSLLEATEKEYPEWLPIHSSEATKTVTHLLSHHPATQEDLILPQAASFWLSDRLSIIGRFIFGFVKNYSSLNAFLHTRCLHLFFALLTSPALPPLFILLQVRHHAYRFLRFIGNCIGPTSSVFSQLIFKFERLVLRLKVIKEDFYQLYPGGVVELNEESLQKPTWKALLLCLKEVHSVFWVVIIILRDLFSGSYDQFVFCLNYLQNFVQVGDLLKSIYSVIPWLFQLLYKQCNASTKQLPALLYLKHSPHEHPGVRASQIETMKNQKSSPSNIRSSASSTILTANELLWGSQARYAFSVINKNLELDSPSSSEGSENTLRKDSSSYSSFSSKTLILETLRSTLVTVRSFAATVSNFVD
ncbi:hypothetical protein IE077_000083 [Cardiosporidium cionae]|uniref:DUF908 domain-containing protein n=1 Tax=Cardiosporidium cionae TaxID=476202 RepID=A0ABQ7J5V2_9APIC|nr:hypothetical protein IE077_000083 [Cardiosporidium cionae]|eukprot:KAF8819372.1 hypothetical protein IE077_000083 [Cardiosporidium cionae]